MIPASPIRFFIPVVITRWILDERPQETTPGFCRRSCRGGRHRGGRDHLRPGGEHHVFPQPHRCSRQHGSPRRGGPHWRAGGIRQSSPRRGSRGAIPCHRRQEHCSCGFQWRVAGPVPRGPGRDRDRLHGQQRHLCGDRGSGQARRKIHAARSGAGAEKERPLAGGIAMIGELGQLALCFAPALSLVMTVAGLFGAKEDHAAARSVAVSSAFGLFVFVALAFGTLTYAFIASDFSILDVASNSNTLKPLVYKISGVWGNHEGSMLLWVLVLSIYAALVGQGLLAAACLLFILFTSNPFLRLDPAPCEGAGLNPLLQDPGLAMHPPMLYAGYVGLSASFSYAAAALLVGEAGWARAARPFMLVAWMALTCGIALGSWWAYYELGWGGFWGWDPVENASLMPWLIATALLHSALATEKSGAFRTWSLLLAIAGFSLSLIGTFLVRSGVITSVHAFATDPTRGFFMLILIG